MGCLISELSASHLSGALTVLSGHVTYKRKQFNLTLIFFSKTPDKKNDFM